MGANSGLKAKGRALTGVADVGVLHQRVPHIAVQVDPVRLRRAGHQVVHHQAACPLGVARLRHLPSPSQLLPSLTTIL